MVVVSWGALLRSKVATVLDLVWHGTDGEDSSSTGVFVESLLWCDVSKKSQSCGAKLSGSCLLFPNRKA